MQQQSISKSQAFHIAERTAEMVKWSHYQHYYSPEIYKCSTGGWVVSAVFVTPSPSGDEFNTFSVPADADKGQIDRYFSGVNKFLSQF